MNTKEITPALVRIGRHAACLAVAAVFSVSAAHAQFISENFETDTPGQEPANASFVISNPDAEVKVVGAGTSPAHPFPTGTQSLLLENNVGGATPFAGFVGTLPPAGIASGSLDLDFFPVNDGGSLSSPFIDVRLGNNSQTAVMGGNDIAVWFRIYRSGGNEFMNVREGGVFRNFDVGENFMNYNAVNSVQINFADASFEIYLNNQLLSIDGQSSFAMHGTLSDINHLNLVSGTNAHTGSHVFVDNVALVPEPSTYALLFGIGALGVLGFRARARRTADKRTSPGE